MDKARTPNKLFVAISLIAAVILWYLQFVVKPVNFWAEMSISMLILLTAAFFSGYRLPKIKKIESRHIIIGIVSAVILYFVFFAGNIISGYLLPFKDAQVLSIYSSKSQGNPVLIALLLLSVIGPGEEIFWRGYIQTTFYKWFGENKGYITAALTYAAVHIITGNLMLVAAALICGFYWGWLYKKEKSLVPVIISHSLWDITIFVLFPLM